MKGRIHKPGRDITKHTPPPVHAQAAGEPVYSWSESISEDVSVQRKTRCSCGGTCPACRGSVTIQPKLRIGAVNDPAEREADSMADRVMRMPDQATEEEESDTEMMLHRTPGGGAQTGVAVPQLAARIQSRRGGGQPLDGGARAYMEPRFGRSFRDVRVHHDAEAADMARQVNARAFTLGRDVFFGAGEYQPGASEGQRLLAHELSHVVQQVDKGSANSLVIQRRPATFRRGTTVRSDPTEARRTFARIRESVQSYSDNSLDYFTNQYRSAMTSFRLWYNRQGRADASFFNSVVNIVMNTAWAWGSTVVGAVAAPVGSIIMLVAQEAARSIQNARDAFADSLIRSANNFQAGIQRRLSGRIPAILERNAPTLWSDIQRHAYLGESWQPLLHQRAGLPRRGVNYQVRLLSKMIFAYRRWALSRHSASYRGIYSFGDPYLTHMQNRATAEAHVEGGVPIPRRLRSYAHPGEQVEQ